MTLLATTYGAGQVAYDLLWFFLFVIEIWLMFSVFVDIFRSHDLPGWAKALWVIFVFAIPLVGILAYLIVRGGQMRAHQLQGAQWWQPTRHFPDGPSGSAAPPRSAHDVIDSLHRLADLRDRGEITSEQYSRLRSELLGETATP
jgi:Short C-terminal domain/Phospholipase_D-nuclease N-terminal